MSHSTLIISTCGTSLFSNTARNARLDAPLGRVSNARIASDVDETSRQQVQAVIDAAQQALLGAEPGLAQQLSAELNGLLAYLQRGKHGTVHHMLLHTDTWLGRESAQLVHAWLAEYVNGGTAELLSELGLRTSTLAEFQFALADLTRALADRLDGYRTAGYQVVFNLTGGFKSINGYLQTVGTFYAHEQFYLFEGSKDVMIIPRLPVTLDPQPTFREHLATYRRLGAKLPVTTDAVRALPETLVVRLDNDVALSAWGELLWQEQRPMLYREQIHASPSTKLIYGSKFLHSTRSIDPSRIEILNGRIDDLARYLETGVNPRSLDFKQLRGTPKPGSTHEIDAWSDDGARRLFGHYDNEIFVLDELDAHLR